MGSNAFKWVQMATNRFKRVQFFILKDSRWVQVGSDGFQIGSNGLKMDSKSSNWVQMSHIGAIWV